MEIEKAYRRAKELLSRNREFLRKVMDALSEKPLLTVTDIRRIREGCEIVDAA